MSNRITCGGCGVPRDLSECCVYCDSPPEVDQAPALRRVIRSNMSNYGVLENVELYGNMNSISVAKNCRIVGNMNDIGKADEATTVIGNMNDIKKRI